MSATSSHYTYTVTLVGEDGMSQELTAKIQDAIDTIAIASNGRVSETEIGEVIMSVGLRKINFLVEVTTNYPGDNDSVGKAIDRVLEDTIEEQLEGDIWSLEGVSDDAAEEWVGNERVTTILTRYAGDADVAAAEALEANAAS